MPDATDLLLDNIDALLECVDAAKSDAEAWEKLCAKVPGIADAMTFNTFRAKAATIARTWKAAMDRTYKADIQKAQEVDIQQDIQPLKGKGFTVAGWYVQADARGYYRAYKKMSGKTKTIYIGRDHAKAEERIKAWGARQ